MAARFVDRFNARLAEARKAAPNAGSLDREIATAEKALANLADGAARAGWSETLGQRLPAQENHLAVLRARRQALADSSAIATAAPHPRAVTAYLRDLSKTLAEAPSRPARCSRSTWARSA